MATVSRREFLRNAGSAAAGAWALSTLADAAADPPPAEASPTQTPPDPTAGSPAVSIELPRLRVPLSFLIDDSTCLVNMGRFCMPQFAAVWPERETYRQPWRSYPAEIPDAFLREFGLWCAEQGVKGKFSIVPYPACVGWLDRELPGWARHQLLDSLKLVRDVMVPNWDIHPEMISHTRVIDLATGRPFADISPATMENSYPQTKKSVDELAQYLSYALRILKNCDLPCEGITTPGGFGNSVKSELSLAVQESVRDVFRPEIPHYFKYIATGTESTNPRIEHARDLQSNDPRLTVNVYAGTGDWFGGWDGVREPQGALYCNADATEGRMVELIKRREPAVMLCHWPGMYGNGSKRGFVSLQQVVLALNSRFADETLWMKASEIARYWAARHATTIESGERHIRFNAPFGCPNWTVRVDRPIGNALRLVRDGEPVAFRHVRSSARIKAGSCLLESNATVVCFDLPRGRSTITWQ